MPEGIQANCHEGPDKVCGSRFGFQSFKEVELAAYGKGERNGKEDNWISDTDGDLTH